MIFYILKTTSSYQFIEKTEKGKMESYRLYQNVRVPSIKKSSWSTTGSNIWFDLIFDFLIW